MTILAEILEHKRRELEVAFARVSPDEMAQRARGVAEPTRGFRAALASADAPAVIAELKRRSPSKGEIRENFDAYMALTTGLSCGARSRDRRDRGRTGRGCRVPGRWLVP